MTEEAESKLRQALEIIRGAEEIADKEDVAFINALDLQTVREVLEASEAKDKPIGTEAAKEDEGHRSWALKPSVPDSANASDALEELRKKVQSHLDAATEIGKTDKGLIAIGWQQRIDTFKDILALIDDVLSKSGGTPQKLKVARVYEVTPLGRQIMTLMKEGKSVEEAVAEATAALKTTASSEEEK